MPSIRELVDNLPNFKYYSGMGTFDANKKGYGNDRPGGGSSGEPYIQPKIGDQWSPGNFDDGFIRNGIVTSTTRTAADVIRIGKFFTDLPKGPLWLSKQVGLQMMNVDTEHRTDRKTDFSTNNPISGQGLINNFGNVIKNGANSIVNGVNKIQNEFGVTRIYNPLGINTLAQVGGSAFGQHFVRHGLVPIMDIQDKYEYVAKQNDIDGNNRLIKLSGKLSDPKNDNEPISEYKGGPGSFFGIGTTRINRSVNTLTTTTAPDVVSGYIPIPIQNLLSINNGVGLYDPTKQLSGSAALANQFDFNNQDFRIYKNIINTGNGTLLATSDYPTQNLHTRIGIARARKKGENRFQYNSVVPDASDRINMVSLFYSNVPYAGIDINDQVVTSKSVRDIVKFRIKAIDNDNPEFGVYMVFRAFLNAFNDKTSARWPATGYVGRGEPFMRYDGYTEGIGMTFTIAAFSKAEMKPIYQKLNYLKSIMTPDYSRTGKMRGTFVEMTVGDWIKYQPGVITDLEIDIPEDTNWEIALTEPEGGIDSDQHELPHRLIVSLTFLPVRNFLPRKSAQLPFIGIDNLEGTAGEAKEWLKGNNQKLKDNYNSYKTSQDQAAINQRIDQATYDYFNGPI